jgi:GT2 family glycosyltransferase
VRDDLIVCTRNRAADLARCLATVAAQRRLPDGVLVCDASDGDETARLVAELAGRSRLGGRLRYLRAAPGLPRQRNLAVAATGGDVVHFVDDDVLLDPGYVEQLDRVFEADRAGAIGGAGGLVTNLPPHHPPRVLELLGLDSRRDGAVLASGKNVQVFAADGLVEVDWLSGCSMSFRRAVFARHRFDERLDGYALGEDADFGYRVRQDHRLVVCGAARLRHLSSPVGRQGQRELVRRELLHRYWRVRQGTGRLTVPAFWVSAYGQLGWLAWRAAAHRSRHAARRLVWTAEGILDIARGRR